MYRYRTGTLTCDEEDVEVVVAAINYLRAQGAKLLCGGAKRTRGRLEIPFVFEESAKVSAGALEKVLDTCRISWGAPLEPRCSKPGSIKVAQQMLATKDLAGKPLTAAELMQADADGRHDGDPFDGLVGLEKQRERMIGIANTVKAFGRDALDSLSMVMVGPPGTGKTELAKKLAAYWRAQGVISKGITLVNAADLVAEHVGGTAKAVNQAFARAEGGVLFVDEAYAITEGDGNDFGVEAVNALVERMDATRTSTMVIACGYKDKMAKFLSVNPGLRERFGFKIELPAYSDQELAKIFSAFAAQKGFRLEDGRFEDESLAEALGPLRKQEGFANARSVRGLMDKAIVNAAQAHPHARNITWEDLEAALDQMEAGATPKRSHVGFL